MKKRSLFAAVAMLVVSAVLLTSATYAWFTAGGNGIINGTSADVVNVSSGVMLRAANNSWVGTLAENATNFPATGDYAGKLLLGNGEAFTPCSSVDGQTFVSYTKDRTDGGFVNPVTDCSAYYKEYQFDVAVVKAGDTVTAKPAISGDAAASARVALIKSETSGGTTTLTTLGVWSSDGAATKAVVLNSGSAYDLSSLNDNNSSASNVAYVADDTDAEGDSTKEALLTSALADQGVSGSLLSAANSSDTATVDTFTYDYLSSTPTIEHLIVRIWIEGQDPQCAPNSSFCPGKDVSVTWTFAAA